MIAVLALVMTCAFALVGCGNKTPVKMIDIKLTDEEYAFGVNKEKADLKTQINSILGEIMSDGTLDDIAGKYFDDSRESERISVPAGTKTANSLVVATNAEFEPFEYKQGSEFTGIDIEVMKLIADRLGMNLVIDNMDFEAVVSTVQAGNADVAAAGLTVNEGRKQQVDFTASYYKASQKIIVKADNKDFDGCQSKEDVENVLNGYKAKKAGYQNGTTGESYIKGDLDKGEDGFGFAGFSGITGNGYTSAALATQDLINGNIDFVVVDEMPANSIVKKMSKK